MAMWDDEIVRQDSRVTYQSRFGPPLKGKSQKVSMQWITNLKWAITHCGSRVRVVVLTAEDAQANPKVVSSCYPDDTYDHADHALQCQDRMFRSKRSMRLRVSSRGRSFFEV